MSCSCVRAWGQSESLLCPLGLLPLVRSLQNILTMTFVVKLFCRTLAFSSMETIVPFHSDWIILFTFSYQFFAPFLFEWFIYCTLISFFKLCILFSPAIWYQLSCSVKWRFTAFMKKEIIVKRDSLKIFSRHTHPFLCGINDHCRKKNWKVQELEIYIIAILITVFKILKKRNKKDKKGALK